MTGPYGGVIGRVALRRDQEDADERARALRRRPGRPAARCGHRRGRRAHGQGDFDRVPLAAPAVRRLTGVPSRSCRRPPNRRPTPCYTVSELTERIQHRFAAEFARRLGTGGGQPRRLRLVGPRVRDAEGPGRRTRREDLALDDAPDPLPPRGGPGDPGAGTHRRVRAARPVLPDRLDPSSPWARGRYDSRSSSCGIGSSRRGSSRPSASKRCPRCRGGSPSSRRRPARRCGIWSP